MECRASGYENGESIEDESGVNGIGVHELKAHLQQHWPSINGHLMTVTSRSKAKGRESESSRGSLDSWPTLDSLLFSILGWLKSIFLKL